MCQGLLPDQLIVFEYDGIREIWRPYLELCQNWWQCQLAAQICSMDIVLNVRVRNIFLRLLESSNMLNLFWFLCPFAGCQFSSKMLSMLSLSSIQIPRSCLQLVICIHMYVCPSIWHFHLFPLPDHERCSLIPGRKSSLRLGFQEASNVHYGCDMSELSVEELPECLLDRVSRLPLDDKMLFMKTQHDWCRKWNWWEHL